MMNMIIFLQNGATPLHWAAIYGSVECLEVLLTYGAEVDQRIDVSFDNNIYIDIQ